MVWLLPYNLRGSLKGPDEGHPRQAGTAPRAGPSGRRTARIEAQHKRGKLTARERVELLLDKGSFEEFDMFRRAPLQRLRHGEDQIPRRRRGHGWGTVNGRTVFLFAKDFTVFGGSLSETHAQKIIKVQDAAMKARAPIIGLFDAGGARIQEGVARSAVRRGVQGTSSPRASSRRSASFMGPARAATSIRRR